jgi:hypothetical protein
MRGIVYDVRGAIWLVLNTPNDGIDIVEVGVLRRPCSPCSAVFLRVFISC